MKRILITLITIGALLSCSENDKNLIESELIGNWKLIEVLADTGDGNGTFQPVESNKTIQFLNNGTVTTNSSLCEPHSEEIVASGSYSLINNTISTNCQNPNISTIYFEMENQYLILNFIDNEGYSQKFQKIN